jgi:hypothetical protein
MISSCIYFKKLTFYGERRKFPHAENTHPREEPREGHSALVERTQARGGWEEKKMSS